MTTTKCDVVVIGAGLSGMTAAYRLKKKDPSLHVMVLEAKDRVGGRTQTVPMKAASGTDHWDLGGQWVGRCQPHIMSLLDELKIDVYPQFLKGTKFMQLGSSEISTYKSDIPSLTVFALIDLQLIMNKCDKLYKQVRAEDPWKCEHAAEWDEMTLSTYLKQNMWTKGARETIETAVRTMFGMETTQMSLLFFLTYTAAADGLKNLIEGTEGTAQEYKICGGAQPVSQRLSEAVGAVNIHLSEPVVSVVQNGSCVTVKTAPGHKYECKRAISAMPPPSLGHIKFHPPLPPRKQELIKRMPLGSMIKIIITYRSPFWRDQGYSGEVVSNGGPSLLQSCDSGPLCIVFDATSSNGNPALVAFIGAAQCNQYLSVSSEERQRCVLHQLVSYFGEGILSFLDYQEKDWNAEPYTGGGPVCCVGTGAMQYFAAGLRAPVDRVHFAGTETATQWCGYLSGAVQAGYRAATEVLKHIHPELVTQDDFDLFTKRERTPRSASSVPWVKLTIGVGAFVVLGAAVSRRTDILALLGQRR